MARTTPVPQCRAKKEKKWNTAFPRSVKEGGRRQRDKGKTKSTTRGEFLPPAIKYCSPLERQCFASWPVAGVSKWEQGVWQEKTVFFPLGARLLRSPTKLYPPTSLWHLAKSSYVHSLCVIFIIYLYIHMYIFIEACIYKPPSSLIAATSRRSDGREVSPRNAEKKRWTHATTAIGRENIQLN